MMDRRAVIYAIAGGVLAPLAAEAQQAGKVWNIGYLISGSLASWANRVEGLRMGLRDLGCPEPE
jgi:hypothetical protein